MLRRHFLSVALAAAALIGAQPGAAFAQSWPSRPITLVVSSAAGAGVDLFARILAEALRPRLGQSVIVDNRPGASGMIAARYAATAAADGYTLFLMPNTLVISLYVLPSNAATVNVLKELEPVIMPVSTMMVMAVNGKFADAHGIRTVKDLLAYASTQADLPWSGSDVGSPMHVMGEQFKKEAGVSWTHVPFQGVAKAVAALVGEQIGMAWMPTSGNTQYFKAGTLRALATLSPQRSPQMPELPTMAELGYKDTRASAWFGILAPLGTPPAIVDRLNREINGVLGMPEVREKLATMGYQPEGGTPQALSAQMREDDERYRRIVADLKIRAQ